MHFTIACAVAADAPDALVTACGFTHTPSAASIVFEFHGLCV